MIKTYHLRAGSPCIVLVGLIYLERLKKAEHSLVLSLRNIQVRKQMPNAESAMASSHVTKIRQVSTARKNSAIKANAVAEVAAAIQLIIERSTPLEY